MDSQTAKRIDFLYRQVKRLMLWSFASLFMQVSGPFLLPIAIRYKRRCLQLKK